jgi:serine/threonine protein kinase
MNQLVRDAQRWKKHESEAHFLFGEAKFVGPYEIKNLIGEGSSGTVKLAVHSQTGQRAAVKIVSKAIARKRRDARKEIRILQNCFHPNIIRLEYVDEDFQNLYIFTEYVECGDLYSYIERNGPLDDKTAKIFARQMVEAVLYCQLELNLVHHDVKLENFVFDAAFQLKLIDFGFAVDLNAGEDNQKITSYDSSPAYACLEILLRIPHDSKCDFFSLGVCFYIMLSGTFPFCDPERTSYEELCRNLQSTTVDFPPSIFPDARDLIEGLLIRKEVMTWESIKNHPWFVRG